MKNSKIFNVLVTVIRWVNRVPYGRWSCVNVVRRRTAESAEKNMVTKKLALPNELRTLPVQHATDVATLQLETQRQKFDKTSWDRLANNNVHWWWSYGDIAGEKVMESMEKDITTKKLIPFGVYGLEYLIYYQYEMNILQTLWRIYALQRKLLSNIKEVTHEKL